MFKHVLVPTDGAPLSNAAAKNAIVLAKSLGARVTGFFAAPEYHPKVVGEYVPRDFIGPAAFAQKIRETGDKHLAVIEKLAQSAGVEFSAYQSTSDFPYQAIIEAAKKKKCDLIYMASHGRRGLGALVLGSETNKVLTHSTIPVLVYR